MESTKTSEINLNDLKRANKTLTLRPFVCRVGDRIAKQQHDTSLSRYIEKLILADAKKLNVNVPEINPELPF